MLIITTFTGCNNTTKSNSSDSSIVIHQVEQPHLYWKDIDVEVVSITKRHWFATVHRYTVVMEVYSAEYDLRKTLDYSATGMFINMPAWDYEKGDIVKAQLYTWMYDSTGEVQKREIHKVY